MTMEGKRVCLLALALLAHGERSEYNDELPHVAYNILWGLIWA